MTRKDFEALACELKAVKPASHRQAEMSAWYGAVFAVAKACLSQNPSFDKKKFLIASGIEPDDWHFL